MPSANFLVNRPSKLKSPVVVSIPHAGTEIPPDIADTLKPKIREELQDTDWYVPELYDFCSELGIITIEAKMSRYVIDLNRPLAGAALYSDQRRQTDALPLTTFDGEPLYLANKVPDATERQRRIDLYYNPYHQTLQRLLGETQQVFGKVLLFDAHSIRRHITALAAEPFADLIVGDREGTSAASILSQTLLSSLGTSSHHIKHNQPFSGGQITRLYGNPANNIHALQLEMAQDIYLRLDRKGLDFEKSSKIRSLLKFSIQDLIQKLEIL